MKDNFYKRLTINELYDEIIMKMGYDNLTMSEIDALLWLETKIMEGIALTDDDLIELSKIGSNKNRK